jgi:hypothetical protein
VWLFFFSAFEICELTGSQVLLVLASETGNVYTYATSQLRAMVDQPEGQALINACLGRREETSANAASSSVSASTTSTTTSKAAASKPLKQEFTAAAVAPLPSDTRTTEQQITTRSRVAKNKQPSDEANPKSVKRQKTAAAVTTTSNDNNNSVNTCDVAIKKEAAPVFIKSEPGVAVETSFVSTPPPSLTPTTTDDEAMFNGVVIKQEPSCFFEQPQNDAAADQLLVGSPYSWDDILGSFEPADDSGSSS